MFRNSLLGLAIAYCFLAVFTPHIAANDDGTEPSDLTADQVLERMAETYAACESYQDSGDVSVNVNMGFGSRANTKPFTTAFVRPDRFRFESKDPELGDPPSRYIVWKNGDKVRQWWDIMKPEEWEAWSLDSALLKAAGPSLGASFRVPALLLPDEVQGQRVDKINEPKRLDDADLDGLTCFRIEGTYDNLMLVLWIDQEQCLLRRLDSRNVDPKYSFSGGATATYHPIINQEVPDKLLEFIPSEDEQKEPEETDPKE